MSGSRTALTVLIDVADSLVNVLDNRLHRTDHGVGVFRQVGDLIRDLRDLGRLPIQERYSGSARICSILFWFWAPLIWFRFPRSVRASPVSAGIDCPEFA